jgi:hypothetical protein
MAERFFSLFISAIFTDILDFNIVSEVVTW